MSYLRQCSLHAKSRYQHSSVVIVFTTLHKYIKFQLMIFKVQKTFSTLLSLLLLSTLLVSCQKDPSEKNETSSIQLISFAGTNITAGSKIHFIVKDNNGQDVTSESMIYLENAITPNNYYRFEEPGSFEIYAKHKGFTSNKLTVIVNTQKPSNSITEFSSKVLVHDFTGTSCGYCANALIKLNSKAAKFPGKVIPVEIHSNLSGYSNETKETFDFPNHEVFGVDRYPTVWYNYDKNQENLSDEQINTLISKKVNTGIAIHYNQDENTVNVKIKSDKPINQNKIVVLLLEGNLTYDQENFDNDNPSSASYKKGKIIKDFEYNNVARCSLTNSELGDIISDATGNEHNISFALTGKTDNINNLAYTRAVVYLLDANNNYINSQVAAANEIKDFD